MNFSKNRDIGSLAKKLIVAEQIIGSLRSDNTNMAKAIHIYDQQAQDFKVIVFFCIIDAKRLI